MSGLKSRRPCDAHHSRRLSALSIGSAAGFGGGGGITEQAARQASEQVEEALGEGETQAIAVLEGHTTFFQPHPMAVPVLSRISVCINVQFLRA